MSASAAAKKSTVLSDAVREQATPRKTRKGKEEAKSDNKIATNPFFKVVFNPNLSEEQRTKEVSSLMTSTMDREQDRANVKSYEEFREWLSAQNTELAKQIISLTNVNTMSELQSVIKDMNGDLMAFDDQMKPIMDIIDSIYQLRTNGAVVDAFREIKEDQERQEQINADIDNLNKEINDAQLRIKMAKDSKVDASTKRSFFGFGGLTKDALSSIARAEMTIEEENGKIAEFQKQVADLKSQAPNTSQLGDMAIHKERLKELLDLSGEENKERVIGLRDAASKFIETAEERTGSLRNQFTELSNQIEQAVDNNSGMKKAYLILNEGLSDAEKNNLTLREELVEKEGESALERSTREEKRRNLDGHITKVKGAQGETLATAADLEQQAVRVYTMQEATNQQIDTARVLNTQGVSATADRLAVVLSAVSGAALGEASAVAQDTLKAMRDSTTQVSQREVIRVAMGADRINDQLSQVADELAELGEVQRAATGIVRNGMSEMEERMAELREQASSMRDAMKDHLGVAAEMGQETEEDAPAASSNSNLFASV